jgi:muscle, skeletal, receptor tyrosine kinase
MIRDGIAIRLPICYEDCVAANLQFCYNDWVLIEENKNKGKLIKSRAHFRLPNCTILPRYDRQEKKCSYVGLVEMKKEEISCKFFKKNLQLLLVSKFVSLNNFRRV